MIMEMPAFAAHGQAMPEVDFVTIGNGEIYQAGLDHTVRVEAVSLVLMI